MRAAFFCASVWENSTEHASERQTQEEASQIIKQRKILEGFFKRVFLLLLLLLLLLGLLLRLLLLRLLRLLRLLSLNVPSHQRFTTAALDCVVIRQRQTFITSLAMACLFLAAAALMMMMTTAAAKTTTMTAAEL